MSEARIRQDEGFDPPLPILWDSVWRSDLGCCDWAVADPMLEPGNMGGLQARFALETAILIQLFTDRRRPDGVTSGDDAAERRGWHGDTFDVQTDIGECAIGSLLWTLERSALVPATVRRAQHYCEEALEPLIRQGIVARFNVTVEVVPEENRLSIAVQAYDATGENAYSNTFTLE